MKIFAATAQEAFIEAGGLRIFLSALDPNAPSAIYKINAAAAQSDPNMDDLEIAAMTQSWFLRVLEELHQTSKHSPSVSCRRTTFTLLCRSQETHAPSFEEVASDLMPLASFVLSSQSYFTKSAHSTETPEDLVETESNSLLIAASLFEALSMDIDALAIAVSQSSATLLKLFDFIEDERIPPSWRSSDALRKNWSMIKSATSRGLIAATSMDDVMMHCLDSEGALASSWIVDRCQDWLQRKDRNDLKICSTVILANLARSGARRIHLSCPCFCSRQFPTDENCIAFVQDLQLVPVLFQTLEKSTAATSGTSLSKKSEGTQILHGVLSLLKHLSIPTVNKSVIGAADPFTACIASLHSSFDGAQPVQVASVGLIKHLVTSCPPNAASFLAHESALESLLGLASRTDDIRLKSESTRVLVQLVRSLWMTGDPAHTEIRQQLLQQESLLALVDMIKSSSKWPILVNEAVVSLALLGSASDGTTSCSHFLIPYFLTFSILSLVNLEPILQDETFLETLSKNLRPSTASDPDSNTSTEGSSSNAKRPATLPEETRINILSLLQIMLLNNKPGAKDVVGKQFRAALSEIKDTDSSSPLQDKAQQVLAMLS